MSEFKTNKISPRKGTTQTIGDSGDSVSTSSGSTITNAGTITTAGITGGTINNTTGSIYLRGEVDWQPGDIKTASFTATDNQGFFVNTTSGEITVTLPASPSAGDVVGIKDYANTFDTNKCILNPNGNKIQGSTELFYITVEGSSIIIIYVDATQGWVITDASKASDIAGVEEFIVASGGTVTTSGDYKIHTFTSPGTFCVSCVGTCSGSNKVDYLVIAGGGGGGKGRAGGGGAGGYRTSYPSPQGTLPVSVQGYPITVGGGASGSSDTTLFGGNGNDSSAIGITSTGGGGGSSNASLAPPASPSSFNYGGHPGGSGGGTAIWTSDGCKAGRGNTPPTTPPQGNPGGANPVGWPNTIATGGGGGASAAGGDGLPSNVSGAGGAGSASSITASPVTRAGGGGGGNDNGNTAGAGGTGGGGAGGVDAVGTNATVNTGSGGGGGGRNSGSGAESNGGNGGSGIVVITYKFQ